MHYKNINETCANYSIKILQFQIYSSINRSTSKVGGKCENFWQELIYLINVNTSKFAIAV